jgi:hypothetical protein
MRSKTLDSHEEQQLRTLVEALQASFIASGELWVAYLGLGGLADQAEVEAHIHGLLSLPALECDLLAEAANELIAAIPPLPRAAYSNDPVLDSSTATSVSPPE